MKVSTAALTCSDRSKFPPLPPPDVNPKNKKGERERAVYAFRVQSRAFFLVIASVCSHSKPFLESHPHGCCTALHGLPKSEKKLSCPLTHPPLPHPRHLLRSHFGLSSPLIKSCSTDLDVFHLLASARRPRIRSLPSHSWVSTGSLFDL